MYNLLDNAYKCDPRVEKFIAQEQEAKAAKRHAKEEAVRKKEQVKKHACLYDAMVLNRREESKKWN